jgi:hypothetical protein
MRVGAIIVVAIIVVALAQVVYSVVVFFVFSGPEAMSTRGQFGDLFGAINAFFTGLAFAGVVVTLFLQRRELEETTTLSIIATLVDAYTNRIDTIEQGKFRGDLWAADNVIKDKIESWDEELAERREALREVDRARELQERVLEDCTRVLEGYDRAKEDLESANERAQDALQLIKDAL